MTSIEAYMFTTLSTATASTTFYL